MRILIEGVDVLTADPKAEYIKNADIGIVGDRIAFIAPPDRNDDGNEYTGASIVKTVSSSFLVLEQVNHDPTSFT